ncbi:hypothetical protein ABIA35_002707 [Catenulispora sp. MAP12-49]|uniref:hypothetical protein n=1 Tax=unclassified Catenulispora TaxID=414885 RepID=UPI0035111913
MTPREAPVPPAIAALPHDPRGYPIPAITPRDADGSPTFAITGAARTLICAIERRCSICGTPMAAGPVYRVIAAAETEALAAAHAAGRTDAANKAPSPEPPGHRACMLFAAFTCPFLARPNARRGQDAEVMGASLARGTARGSSAEAGSTVGGAVAGFADYEFSYTPGSNQVAFLFTGLTELRTHQLGADQIPELVAALADAEPPTESCPPYLLDDEEAAGEYARALLEAAMARSRAGGGVTEM